MATAEEMLREAQYEMHCISYGNDSANRGHTARAEKLATKIMRKYPGTSEAKSAYSLMMQLGNSAFSGKDRKQQWLSQHDHGPDPKHSHQNTNLQAVEVRSATAETAAAQLDWTKLIQRLLALPKAALITMGFVGFILFSIFGWFFIILLLAAGFAISPMRGLLPESMRKETEGGVKAVNKWLNGQ